MGITEIILISIGLAMDDFAVSVCKGLSMKKMDWKKAIIIGLWFGVFQAGMPVIGYILGSKFEHLIVSIDHWIIFALLSFIGIKMIKEALSEEAEGGCNDDIGVKIMLVLALATSIDALAVGITFAFLNTNIVFATLMIGIITWALSILGVKIGNKFGDKYQSKAEFAGGLILILLGIKILLEHLGFIV